MTALAVMSFPCSVLVVDDEPVVRQVVKETLGQDGLAVVEAVDGEAAIEQLDRVGFGCMVVDKNLPGIGGLDVMRHGRRVQPYCASIIMTAHASIDSAVEALRLGASDYLLKPFDDVNLVAVKVDKAMRHAQARFENERLVAQIREMASELDIKDEKISSQQSEIGLFDSVLRCRLDLESKAAQSAIRDLEHQLAECRLHLPTVIDNTRSLLVRVRAVFRNPDADVEALRAALQQVLRVLERNLTQFEKLSG